MGLNGRKLKQRIGNDPRNLSWADDAARFGINYLAKFGWDSSKGLGASGEGRKSHLEVSKKLDMLGIGAAHQLDPNGIAWKQNKDFENLLKRLNGDVVEASAVEGFMKADSDEVDGVGQERSEQAKEKKEGKRKRKDDGKESPKKKKKIEEDEVKRDHRVDDSIDFPATGLSERRRTVPTLPRHRAHRARAIAAKNLSSKSATHISEILGIAPTTSSLSTTATSSGLASSTDTPQDVESHEYERITTSTKSVHDYFNEKLKTKKPSTFAEPSARHTERESHNTPRGGLGSASRTAFGSSRLSSTFLAAASQSIPSVTSSRSEVAVEARVDTENIVKKKKRSKVTDEHEDNCVKRKSEVLVSDDDTGSLREGNIVDVGECHSKRPVEEEKRKNTTAGDNPLANLTTKEKKRTKAEKRKAY